MRLRLQALGLWLLLAVVWNDALPASPDGMPSELSASGGRTGQLKAELKAHERAAVERDLHELHLLEEVLTDKQSRHVKDATAATKVGESDSIDLTNADEPLPDGGNPALEDRAAFEHRAATNDPFLPAEKLIKSEENATAMASFKGPHADVSRQIHRVAKNTNKEVFGGANEAKTKMERIKKDTEKLQKVAIREAKELNIVIPKPGAKAEAKETNVNPWDVESYAEDNKKPSDKPAPKINFSGAGSGAPPRSGLYTHDQGNVMGREHHGPSATSGMPHELLGEGAGPNTPARAPQAKHKKPVGGKDKQPVGGKGHQVGKNAPGDKNPPGDTLTIEAIKMEEEEIVREMKGKPAAQVVDTLDAFMHRAHEARNKNREAWLQSQESQVKGAARHKAIQRRKMANRSRVPIPADQMAVQEGKREHEAAAKKAKRDAADKATQAAADAKVKAANGQKQAAAAPQAAKSTDKSTAKQQSQPSTDSKQAQHTESGQKEQHSPAVMLRESKAETANESSKPPAKGEHAPAQAKGHTATSPPPAAAPAHAASTGKSSNGNAKASQNSRKNASKGSTITSIQEQRPPASEVAKAMRLYGAGGVHCKDCS